MNVIIIIFITLSSLLSLSTLGYVGVDIYNDVRREREERLKEQQLREPEAEPFPVPVTEEPVNFPAPVEHIDAEEADAMISDELAMRSTLYERGAGTGQKDTINIGEINAVFAPHDVITLAVLKEKMLVPKKVGRIKILAGGILTKPLTVKAESFSVQAIKMIELTGGTVIILKD